MNARSVFLLALAAAATLTAIASWYHAQQALRESRALFVVSTLEPIAALLREDQALLKDLESEPFTEKDSGMLQSYLSKIRRDGIAKNAQMKQRLDQLAENNTEIVTLLKAYTLVAKTPTFTTEGDKFRNYASAWRDRWNSVMELFMAGGNYPESGVSFPGGFLAAVHAEIAARGRSSATSTNVRNHPKDPKDPGGGG